MKYTTPRENDTSTLEASPLVRKFASKIASASKGAPILDVACGSGRNARLLVELGCTVICIDNDLSRLKVELVSGASRLPSSLLVPCHLDLVKDSWPFEAASVGGIINVHFLLPALLSCFAESLIPGTYLLLESVPGCGGNYVQLPAAGRVRSVLERAFDFEFYKENKVGPPGSDAVTVKVVARRAGGSTVRAPCEPKAG
jgi:SAM-dependent methyltransferase